MVAGSWLAADRTLVPRYCSVIVPAIAARRSAHASSTTTRKIETRFFGVAGTFAEDLRDGVVLAAPRGRRALAEERHERFDVAPVTELDDGALSRGALIAITGVRTAPLVFEGELLRLERDAVCDEASKRDDGVPERELRFVDHAFDAADDEPGHATRSVAQRILAR